MEGALVRQAPLPLTRRRASRTFRHGGCCRRSLLTKGPWQRRRVGRGASEATSRARFAAEKAATGRYRAEELSIGAPPGPRGALFDASVRGPGSGRAQGTGRERWLKLEGRRQAMLHPWICRRSNDRRRVGAADRRSPREGLFREAARAGIGWSVLGARGRKSVAEVGERHLSPSKLGASTRAGQRGDSLKRPVGL
jgi:hypothetical protein